MLPIKRENRKASYDLLCDRKIVSNINQPKRLHKSNSKALPCGVLGLPFAVAPDFCFGETYPRIGKIEAVVIAPNRTKMTTVLTCALILALWSLPLNYMPTIARFSVGGVPWAMSNRESMPKIPPWAERAERAQKNHFENLPILVVTLLVVQLTGQANPTINLAAISMVIFRIFHGFTYVIGIPLLRSLSFVGSLLALSIILWQLLG